MKHDTKHMRTVGDLVAMLKKLPQDSFVILQRDSEGGYSPLADMVEGHYVPETTWSGDLFSDDPDEFLSVEDMEEAKKEALPSVFFFPVN